MPFILHPVLHGSSGLLPSDSGQAGSAGLLWIWNSRASLAPALPRGGEGGGGEGFGEHPASPSPLTLQAEAAWVMPGRGLCSLTQFSLFFSKRRGLVIQLVPTAKGCRGSYGRRVFALWWR